MFYKFAKWVTSHPKMVLSFWALMILTSLVFAMRLPHVLSTGGFNNPRSPSTYAQHVIARDFPQASPNTVVIVMQSRQYAVTSGPFHQAITRIATRLHADPAVAGVTTYDQTHVASLIGDHHHATFVMVRLATTSGNVAQTMVPGIRRVVLHAMPPTIRAWVTGGPALNQSLNTATLHGVAHAEDLAFPLLIGVLLLVLGTIVATALPLIIAITVLPITMAMAYVIVQFYSLNILMTDVISMIGLGVIVDYAVFIIHRYRKERPKHDTTEAIVLALATSGRSVFFSGVTVIVSLLSLLLGRLMILSSIAIGGALVVFVAVLASWSLLPALLMILGPRIEWGRLPWYRRKTTAVRTRWVQRIMRYPLRFLIPVVAVLGVLALPVASLHMQVPVASARALPAQSSARQGLDLLKSTFPAAHLFPIDIVVQSAHSPITSPANLATLAQITRVVQHLSGVSSATSAVTWHSGWTSRQYYAVYHHWMTLPATQRSMISQWINPSRSTSTALIVVQPVSGPNSLATHQLIPRIQHALQGIHSLRIVMGGQTAVGYGFDQAIQKSFPLMIGVVLGVTALILMGTFRSIVLPIKALIMNAMVTLASMGVLVAVFQWGVGGLTPAHATLNSVTPVVVFAVLFGLSMDYEVFIVNHIREQHHAGSNTEESIIQGVSETSRLVTGAAAIMIAVFVAFATVPIGVVKQLGIGLATAIFLDAVIVRTTLLPAVMRVLGSRSWWGSSRKQSTYKEG